MHDDHNNRTPPEPKGFLSTTNIAFIGFIAIAGFYLVAEHRAHLFGYLPFILLLACPLLHMFMHGGHGHRGNDSSRQPPPGTGTGSHH